MNAMTMRSTYLPAAILLGLVGAKAPAAPPNIKCPESVNAESLQFKGIPKEWVPFVASPLYLHAAAPMNGPPEMRGDLADFTERRNRNSWTYSYRLDGSFPDGKWLQCAYGEYNEITLSQRMPDDVRACTFTYRKGAKAGQHDIDINCR